MADADPATRSACARLGESWGVAFQMIDDVNNFSTSPQWSKMRGEDVAEGKHSYVIHKAALLGWTAQERLLDIMTTRELRRTEPGLARPFT
ncbi:MAG: polyprenyl synthetase family protein [Desulfobacterales bacterium]|nr:polyprenyl synthetase family protein [Desulfobacterales bacterium]